MSHIKFNIKYRPQIESGEYKVVTRSGYPVNIVCWNAEDLLNEDKKFSILGLLQSSESKGSQRVEYFAEDGSYARAEKSPMDLFIVVDNLPDIPDGVSRGIYDLASYCIHHEAEINDESQFIGRYTKEIWKSFCDWLGEQDKLMGLVQQKELLKGIPKWKTMFAGAGGNGDGQDAFLVKSGFGYRLSPVISAGDEYLELSELEKLPKLG